MLSSLISALLDVLLFSLAHYTLGWSRIGAQIGARVISATVNYLLNSRMVFGKKPTNQSFARYAALALCVLGCSCLGHLALEKLRVPAILAKILVDGLLYFLSYRVQRSKVFGG